MKARARRDDGRTMVYRIDSTPEAAIKWYEDRGWTDVEQYGDANVLRTGVVDVRMLARPPKMPWPGVHPANQGEWPEDERSVSSQAG